MEPVGRLIANSKRTSVSLSAEEIARNAWPVAVGKRLAARTNPVGLFGTLLVVETEDSVWQRQLTTLRFQILAKLEQVTGRKLAEDIEFRVARARRMPQREQSRTGLLDESAGITDPVLQIVYKTSRKRSSA